MCLLNGCVSEAVKTSLWRTLQEGSLFHWTLASESIPENPFPYFAITIGIVHEAAN